MKPPLLLIAVAAALLVPSVARAGDVAFHVQPVPLGARSVAAAEPEKHFNMLALHWSGGGGVEFRTHRLHGGWSGWQSADADTAPDGGTGRTHDGNLVWTGAADRFGVRTHGRVSGLRAYELWSRVEAVPGRTTAGTTEPPVVTRAQWGANEEIVRAKPLVAPSLRLAVVHHTAGTNTYTRAQAAAIVRGIQAYHVLGNGWNDIGYNFLVDRFGTVYEGRGGGMERPVIGAHAQGFNTGTVGIALIGTFQSATPPAAMQSALVHLLAWRLDVAHLDPLGRIAYTSGGNAKFRAGRVVVLNAISGHRDTGPTECPGNVAERLLPRIARRVAVTGLPKIYGPTVIGIIGGPIRFRARLSSPRAWTVRIVDGAGAIVATGSGVGRAVDWTWASGGAGAGPFTWSITTGSALPASGRLGAAAPVVPTPVSPLLTGLAVTPRVAAPAPDGTGGTVAVGFHLGTAATVGVRVADDRGAVVLVAADEQLPAGQASVPLAVDALADGRYRLVATAAAGSRVATKAVDLVVDRTLTGLVVTPALLTPNGDGVDDAATFTFLLAASVPLRLDIEAHGAVLATPYQGQPPAGSVSLTWDGTQAGVPLPPGAYTAVVTVTDSLGEVGYPVPVTLG
jgi:hypothetical protein